MSLPCTSLKINVNKKLLISSAYSYKHSLWCVCGKEGWVGVGRYNNSLLISEGNFIDDYCLCITFSYLKSPNVRS